MATAVELFVGDTAAWVFTLKRGGAVLTNLTGATAKLTCEFLGISAATMTVSAANSQATYSPTATDVDIECYYTPATVVVTFADTTTQSFPFLITIKPRGDYWERVTPTTSTSTTSSTSTTTTI